MDVLTYALQQPELRAAAFLAGWLAGMVVGYILARLVLR